MAHTYNYSGMVAYRSGFVSFVIFAVRKTAPAADTGRFPRILDKSICHFVVSLRYNRILYNVLLLTGWKCVRSDGPRGLLVEITCLQLIGHNHMSF